jgi:hypothetical protein
MPDVKSGGRRATVRFGRAAAAVLSLLLLSPIGLSADPSPRSRWSWTPLGYGIGERGLSALDVDGDGRAELFAAPQGENYWYELRREGLFRQSWSSFLEEAELVAMDAVSTPSGAKVAVLYSHSLRIFDAISKVQQLNVTTATWANTDVALGDLDLDGVLDAVVCDNETLYLYELANGTQTALRPGFGCSDVVLGQTDADPQLEIVIAGNPTGGYVLDGVSLVVEWGDLAGFGPQIALGDLDGDGRDEILASSDSDTAARALDPESNSELWRREGNFYPPTLFVADLDPAPGSEAIVHERYGNLFILTGTTGEVIRTHAVQTSPISRFAAADTDGDGDLELLWSGGECCYSFDDIWALEGGSNVLQRVSEGARSMAGVFAVGKFGGDQVNEIAIAAGFNEPDQAPLQIEVLEMAQGRPVRRSSFAPTTSGNVAAMIGMRVDADAAPELCLASNDALGPVRCVDGQTFEEEWSGGSLGYVDVLAAAELDGDPAPEILAGTSGPAIEAREGDSGWLKWRTPEIDPNLDAIDRLLAIDVDGDGLDEVIGRLATYYYGAGGLALFSGASGDLLSGPWDWSFWAMAKPALMENPPHRVYVALSDSTIRGLDPQTGNTTAPLATLPGISRQLAVVDLDRDGALDFIVVDQFMHLHVVDGATATVAWTGPYLGPTGYGWVELSLEAGDLDGNGVPDFAVASRYGLFFFEGPLFEVFMDGFETGDTLAWSATLP